MTISRWFLGKPAVLKIIIYEDLWLKLCEKGLSDVCVNCPFRSDCTVCAGKSETTLSISCVVSVYSMSTLAQDLMEW